MNYVKPVLTLLGPQTRPRDPHITVIEVIVPHVGHLHCRLGTSLPSMETSTSSHPLDSKTQDVPPMLEHRDIVHGVPFPGPVKLLIYIADGRTTMEEMWAGTYPGSPVYPEWRGEMRERMAHNDVVGILPASVRPLSGNEPGRAAPRHNLGVSLGAAFAGLTVGSCVVSVIGRSTSDVFCNVRLQFWFSL